MTITDYISLLISKNEYTFTRIDLIKNIDKSKSKIQTELNSLIRKKEVMNLRHLFYVIFTEKYPSIEVLPIQIYIDKLFSFLNNKYYLSLFTAAKYHGVKLIDNNTINYVTTNKRTMVDIKREGLHIKVLYAANWPKKNSITKREYNTTYKISSPALTAVDIIFHQNQLGGMIEIIPVLKELFPKITTQDLHNLLSWYPHRSCLQRLGFLLDQYYDNALLTEPLYKHITKTPIFPVVLTPVSKPKGRSAKNRWKIIVNTFLPKDNI